MPKIGDQTLKERSSAVLSGGVEWPAGRFGTILDRGLPSTGVSVLQNQQRGDIHMANLRTHWPMIALVMFAVLCLWWYNKKV